MKNILITIFWLIQSIFLAAQTYSLEKSSISSAGDRSSSSTYILADAIGQSLTGKSTSSTYIETAGILHMNLGIFLGVSEGQENGNINIPTVFSLSGTFPNPCADRTTIRFAVPVESKIFISLYDISGREVVTLVNQNMNPGYYEFDLNVANYSTGIYFLRMNADEFSSTRKLIITR
ncbi:MAG: hypothetical protein APR63_00200 [Desulfuromonas sp. SDB]|nr:MAG: hypothetical protein APR63_00200 [Desulfuromonas sp. SDB]